MLSLLIFKILAICIETGTLMLYRKSSKRCKQGEQLNLSQILEELLWKKSFSIMDY